MGKVIVKKDTPHQCFARLELNNGDQVMISVVPAEVKVIKMNWAGMLPGPTLWKSGSGAEIAQKFFDETKLPQRLIDAVIDSVIDCRSAADVAVRLSAKPDEVLAQYVATLGKTGRRVVRDVSELPYPKDLIKSALRHHLKKVNGVDKKAVEAGRLRLSVEFSASHNRAAGCRSNNGGRRRRPGSGARQTWRCLPRLALQVQRRWGGAP